jgi:hypothetical protein
MRGPTGKHNAANGTLGKGKADAAAVAALWGGGHKIEEHRTLGALAAEEGTRGTVCGALLWAHARVLFRRESVASVAVWVCAGMGRTGARAHRVKCGRGKGGKGREGGGVGHR